MAHIDLLPPEAITDSFDYLTTRELFQLQRVSRRWQQQARAVLASRTELDLWVEVTRRDVHFILIVRGRELRYMFQLLPQLKRLRCGWVRFRRKHFGAVASLCVNLTSLDLRHGQNVSNGCLKKLCRVRGPTLDSFTPPSGTSGDFMAQLLLLLPRLRELQLSGETAARCLALLPDTLKRLRLYECEDWHQVPLRYLTRCTRLTELEVHGRAQHIPPAGLKPVLFALPSLQRLSLSALDSPFEQNLPGTGMPQLRHLTLAGYCSFTDETLKLLPRLTPGLRSLELCIGNGVTEVGMCHVKQLRELCGLSVRYLSDVSDKILDHLCSDQLRHLELEGTEGEYTDDVIVHVILNSPVLQTLHRDDKVFSDLTGNGKWECLPALLPEGRHLRVTSNRKGLEVWLRKWHGRTSVVFKVSETCE